MWPHEITLSKTYYDPHSWHSTPCCRARSRRGGRCKTRPGFLCCNFNDDNHWQSARFPGLHFFYLARGGIDRESSFSFLFFLVESEWTTYSTDGGVEGGERKEEKRKEKKNKTTLTASDSVSFQSARIRFITFVSLHLVDASRVRLHWYGRGGLSCDYDIFLGALSSHSISLG